MRTCSAKVTIGGVEFTCEVRGHTKPNTYGPVHIARGRDDRGASVIVEWPTKSP